MKKFNIMSHLGIRSTKSIKKMYGKLAYFNDRNGNSYHTGYIFLELRNKKVVSLSLPKSYGYDNALNEAMNDLCFNHEQQAELRARKKSEIDVSSVGYVTKKEFDNVYHFGVVNEYENLSKIKHDFRLKNNLI